MKVSLLSSRTLLRGLLLVTRRQQGNGLLILVLPGRAQSLILMALPLWICRKLERVVSVCQLVSDDTHRPDVNPMVTLVHLPLWREVVDGAAEARRGRTLGPRRERRHLPEVEEHGSERVREHADVVWLDVAVDPAVGVEEPEASESVVE